MRQPQSDDFELWVLGLWVLFLIAVVIWALLSAAPVPR